MVRMILWIGLLVFGTAANAQDVRVASKNFTENRLMGEILTQWIETETDLEVEHVASLGGTKVCWDALLAGQVDLYVDYTGTGWAILLKEEGRISDPLRAFLHVQHECRERFDVDWLAPFGFNNTYALALRRDRAEALGVRRISDLIGKGGDLRTAFSIEFMNREDGWPGLAAFYEGLDLEPRSMEHGLAYEALAKGEVDLVDAYSTDGKLLRYDVRVLDDDLGFFPPYNAAPVVRGQVLRDHPELRNVLWKLAHTMDDAKAMELNHRIEVGGEDFVDVARSFLVDQGLLLDESMTVTSRLPRDERTAWSVLVTERGRILQLLIEHLLLVLVSVGLATVLAVPAGIWGTRRPWARRVVLGAASVMQTIPSLALLAFLISIPWIGLGARAAILALLLYAVLPILRNTVTGIESVDPAVTDAAQGLGLTRTEVLLRIQLPLAMRTILAGLRTATVIGVGVATLAAFIGAGGLGQLIVEGLYLNDTSLILAGAIPAAGLALVADAGLGRVEAWLTPRGLRASVSEPGPGVL